MEARRTGIEEKLQIFFNALTDISRIAAQAGPAGKKSRINAHQRHKFNFGKFRRE